MISSLEMWQRVVISIVILLVFLGIVWIATAWRKENLRKTRREIESEMEELKARTEARFKMAVQNLTGRRVGVVFRGSDGKIVPFETLIRENLTRIGVEVEAIPGKKARKIWEELSFEGEVADPVQKAEFYIVGTRSQKAELMDVTEIIDYNVYTPDFKTVVTANRFEVYNFDKYDEYLGAKMIEHIGEVIGERCPKTTKEIQATT